MRYTLLTFLLMTCKSADYVQVETVRVKLIKKEVLTRYPNDRVAQYWEGDRFVFFQALPVGDTGQIIGTYAIVFKPK